MITIHHNFDETKFKWLWARYVKSGNIEKHCVNSIPGTYSKKFSGASNHDLLQQPELVMDEVPEGKYEAIYFCGVLKKGYLNKDPLKNNYPHNVHFAVRPVKGAHDTYEFENWHVEIEGGVLENIPATYELKEKFFIEEPYTSHYYTCRIFRWMVGHFFPEELQAQNLTDKDRKEIKDGYDFAEKIFTDYDDSNQNNYWQFSSNKIPSDIVFKKKLSKSEQIKNYLFEHDLIKREDLRKFILSKVTSPSKLFQVGIEEYLEKVLTYQDRIFIGL